MPAWKQTVSAKSVPPPVSSWSRTPTTCARRTSHSYDRSGSTRQLDVAGFFPGPPDIAIEVISPSDLYTEVDEKVADYLAAGTQAVIVVNPRRRTVKVHRPLSDTVELTESDTLEVSDIVPGWQMPVREMFE